MEVLSAGSGENSGRVWIENHPTEGWVPGTVDSLGGNGCYIVVDEEGEQFEIPQDKARPVDPACLNGVEDLLSLGDFNEGALLHNVRVRYFKDEIYTGIGGPILISMNPFMNLPSLYAEQKRKFYRDAAAAAGSGRGFEVPPHLFSVGASSYTAMLGDAKNQSIIISGESGAGKTEATKRILAYFASLQQNSSEAKAGGMNIEDQVLRSNPILEAFGNAKTLRNDNSSRFGKYIDIEFDATGKLRSARISNYLLEKSRIVKQQPDERGYHAFYFLCAGAPSLEISSTLGLQDASEHTYICGCTEIPGVDDTENFQEMADCMVSLGFSTEEQHSIFKVTAAVLHMGDLEFAEHANSADGCRICDPDKAAQICQLLQVDIKDFTKVFQFKTLEDPFTKKVIDMPQNEEGSCNTRHSMARATYSRLFDWLVWRINQSTSGTASKKNMQKIGILDIYGFEVFEWNSFEQLCINFANEKLQQHFNSHMFTLEQRQYSDEGISWSHIDFADNSAIIEALEKKPVGLFCLIDAECLMPKATDMSCLNKIYKTFEKSDKCYKPSRFASTNFGVAHYAGEVIYDITTFLEKNTDKLHSDIINLLKTSKLPVLKSLYSDPKFAPELGGASAGSGSSAAARGSVGVKKPGGPAKSNVTVSMMFRQQLDQLVEDLNKTCPRYIRCIKPNAAKAAHEFDSIDVRRQLRCAGMLEAIRIRRAGYSVRRPFKEFCNRFRVLCPLISAGGSKADPDYKDLSKKILTEMEAKFQKDKKKPLEEKSWQVGRSKVFMKEELQSRLEESIGEAIQKYVICVQKRWRGFTRRRWYKAVKKSVGLVQAGLRTAKAVSEFKANLQKHNACLSLQTGFRTLAMSTKLKTCRAAAVKLQKVFRGWSCRMREKRKQEIGYEVDVMKQEAEKKRKALEDMQNQIKLERERAEKEANQKMAEQEKEFEAALQAKHAMQEKVQAGSPAKTAEVRKQEQQQLEKTRQEILALRKENAKLQGQIDCRPSTPSGGPGASSAELQQLRQELQEVKREKIRLEVDMVGMKGADELTEAMTELQQLQDEVCSLKMSKLEADAQLEQCTAELDAAQSEVASAQQTSVELSVLRAATDDIQVQLQRAEAQKVSLEERVQENDTAQDELQNLRLEKMRLEGELETSRMTEQAVKDKMKSAETNNLELQHNRQRLMTSESELEVSRKHVERLTEQVRQMTQNNSAANSDSLDTLRSELLSRIETRSSITPMDRPQLSPRGEEGAGLGDDRKSVLNQRAIFEQLRNQFNEANNSGMDDGIDHGALAVGDTEREAELEEDIRIAQKESVDLNIQMTSLQEELNEKAAETANHLKTMSLDRAELEDLKFQLEQEVTNGSRTASEIDELQQTLCVLDAELVSLRRKLAATEEDLVQTEEEANKMRQKADRFDEERDLMEKRAQELQRQVTEFVSRAEDAAEQVANQHQLLEQQKNEIDAAERTRIESLSTTRFLESENEHLKVEVQDTTAESLKTRQVVEELITSQRDKANAHWQQEMEKWKKRTEHFEREYQQSKQLNSEMTKVMSQMTQAVSERSDQNTDFAKENKVLLGKIDAKSKELRTAKQERDETQRQLDNLMSQGSYFKDKYRQACNEMQSLRQEHSVSTVTSTRLKSRVEALQGEIEDVRTQISRATLDSRTSGDSASRIDRYESHVRDLQMKLRAQDDELERSKAFAAKSQQVNDCLNTLLVLESEQTSLYEMNCPIADRGVTSQFEAKKSKAQSVISRLNDIMSEEERPSIAFLQERNVG